MDGIRLEFQNEIIQLLMILKLLAASHRKKNMYHLLLEWSGKTQTNISCVDENNVSADDGSITYNSLAGGKSFIGDNNIEYYKYELDFGKYYQKW